MATTGDLTPKTKPALGSATVPADATSAEDMNARTQMIDGLGDGFDGFRTARMPDGRWLSFTGDAIAQDGQVWPVYDNAAVIWEAGTQRRVESPWPGGHFFPRWPDGGEFWPNQFVVADGRAYVIGSRVLPVSGEMAWTAMGAYGAVVDLPAGADPLFAHYWPTPSSLLGDEAVQWSAAIATDGTWMYVHGVLDRPDQFHARDGGYVARAPLARLGVPHRWEVWTGSSWSAHVDQAVATIPTGGAPTHGTASGYTLHQRPDGTWAVTTKAGGELADTLGRYTAATPWGPWTWENLLTVGGLDSYLTGAAPGIPTVSGKLLVQWSRRGSTPYWAEVPQ